MIKDVSVILNAIRETASSAYQTAVPMATATNIQDVGKAVLGLPSSEKNEFINAVNKIGLTLIDTPAFENPFIFLRKGTLEYGSTIEDLFIEMARPHNYIAGTREGDDIPDQFEIFKAINHAGFYSTQLERQYAQTYHEADMRRAFYSPEGLGRFIAGMAQAQASGENVDDYRMTVALMARQAEKAISETGHAHKGRVKLITLYNATAKGTETPVTADNCMEDKDFLQFMSNQFKKWSNRLTHIRKDLNIAGVENFIPKASQRIMMLQDVQADLDTNLFAWAYNQNRLEIGGFDEIDSWYSIGADATTPTPTSMPESINVKSLVATSTKVLAVIYDPNMIKIYNKFRIADTAKNARGHYYTTFTTVADIYAASPFTNFVVFTLD